METMKYFRMLSLCLTVCTAIVIGVDGSQKRITELVIYNASATGFNALTCSRLKERAGIVVGCRMNITSKQYDELSLDHCINQDQRPGFVYMHKYHFFVKPTMTETPTSAYFSRKIPMCMKLGSRIEFSFIPKSGWSSLSFFMKNRDGEEVLKTWVKDTYQIVTFQSTLNDTIINKENCAMYPILTDQSNKMLIELGEDAFIVYHNDVLFCVYTYKLDNNIPQLFQFQFIQVVGELSYVKFTK